MAISDGREPTPIALALRYANGTAWPISSGNHYATWCCAGKTVAVPTSTHQEALSLYEKAAAADRDENGSADNDAILLQLSSWYDNAELSRHTDRPSNATWFEFDDPQPEPEID